MADETRGTLVAIRIGRPYRTQDDFLAHELDTLTRTTATLIGAQAKPQGVILRFEMTLSTGEPLLRGEGRVVGFRPETPTSDSALTLRFTRLDARSKALVDRAAAMRDARGRTSHPPPPIPPTAAEPTPPPPAAAPTHAKAPAAGHHGPPPLPKRSKAPAPPAQGQGPRQASAEGVEAPPDRERLLDRLRERARALPEEAVASILAKRQA